MKTQPNPLKRMPGGLAAAAVLVLFWAVSAAEAAVPLVESGQARAVVVTSAEPSPTVEYAADELVRHVERATGVTLPVAREGAEPDEPEARIYLGDTRAAREAGIDIEGLDPDAFALKTAGDRLFIAAAENAEADPLDFGRSMYSGDTGANPYGGPMFGVYELLRRDAGVRWLWPGELGTYVPGAETIEVDSVDEVIGPKLRFRRYRLGWMLMRPERYDFEQKADPLERVMGGSPTDAERDRYARALHVFARRHLQGYSYTDPGPGHGNVGIKFSRQGEEHPEWFAMNAEGERVGPRLCVSDEEVHRAIVERWVEKQDAGPRLNLGGADSMDYCLCEECIAWDAGQEAEPGEDGYVYSDRYAKFWQKIHELAKEHNPDVTLTVYMYNRHWPAPLEDVELSENIHGQFVPWGTWVDRVFFPMSRRNLEWRKEQWLGWAETGMSMAYRPNEMLQGYAMPSINTWQLGDFLRFAYRNGMRGMDVDSLTGQWAVRGPQIYMAFRLMADPESTVQEIREDYFAAFGPAAEEVERYFDFWERYQYDLLENGMWASYWRSADGVAERYPPERFAEAQPILRDALRAAKEAERSDYAERVEFLMNGLEHAYHSARLVGLIEDGLPDDPEHKRFQEAKQALADLLAFRRSHDYPPPVVDYMKTISVYGNEGNRYRAELETLLQAMEDEGPGEKGARAN